MCVPIAVAGAGPGRSQHGDATVAPVANRAGQQQHAQHSARSAVAEAREHVQDPVYGAAPASFRVQLRNKLAASAILQTQTQARVSAGGDGADGSPRTTSGADRVWAAMQRARLPASPLRGAVRAGDVREQHVARRRLPRASSRPSSALHDLSTASSYLAPPSRTHFTSPTLPANSGSPARAVLRLYPRHSDLPLHTAPPVRLPPGRPTPAGDDVAHARRRASLGHAGTAAIRAIRRHTGEEPLEVAPRPARLGEAAAAGEAGVRPPQSAQSAQSAQWHGGTASRAACAAQPVVGPGKQWGGSHTPPARRAPALVVPRLHASSGLESIAAPCAWHLGSGFAPATSASRFDVAGVIQGAGATQHISAGDVHELSLAAAPAPLRRAYNKPLRAASGTLTPHDPADRPSDVDRLQYVWVGSTSGQYVVTAPGGRQIMRRSAADERQDLYQHVALSREARAHAARRRRHGSGSVGAGAASGGPLLRPRAPTSGLSASGLSASGSSDSPGSAHLDLFSPHGGAGAVPPASALVAALAPDAPESRARKRRQSSATSPNRIDSAAAARGAAPLPEPADARAAYPHRDRALLTRSASTPSRRSGMPIWGDGTQNRHRPAGQRTKTASASKAGGRRGLPVSASNGQGRKRGTTVAAFPMSAPPSLTMLVPVLSVDTR